ncbi:MAG: TonB-dependent receptor [Gammaproteobacteria bacterium]|nr:TonB-dependent receptor [Gammaproteobacteria bacterium]MBU1408597.1 TonB-dependent receptor [Gammaproteobacteria bacterium]MBU1532409.1 TonB-dependent receptor [Gammaproteobacteria bacterium]
MLRPALLAAALTAAFPVHADPELDALRAELQELKSAYEARIQALEARLQKTEAQTADAAVKADTAPVRSSFNPDVSLILQGKYAYLEDRADRGITGFLPSGAEGPSRGFSVDESELVLSASIDPWFRGYLNAVLADGEVGVEEAWFQTTGLGQGLSVKGGRFRSGIGYQNEQHPHAWDFATNSLVYEALFGEGYGQDGLQMKWLAPTDTFLEFGAEAGRGGAFPSTERDSNGFPSLALFGHVGDDVGTSHSWRAGLSYLHARPQARAFEGRDLGDVDVAGDFSGKSRTWLADFVWKWAPNGNATQQNFKFAAEYFQRRERGSLFCDDADPANPSGCTGGLTGPYSADQSGFYAQGVYQFMPHWRVGYRYDQLFRGDVVFDGADAGATLASLADYDPRRHSLMLDYSPSEFSRLRLQYSRDEAQQDIEENQFYVQYIYSLGSHGAHKF